MVKHLHPPSIAWRTADSYPQHKTVGRLLQPWDGRSDMDVGLIGVPLSKGGVVFAGSDAAPGAIRKALCRYTTYSLEYDADIEHVKVRDLGDIEVYPTSLLASHSNVEAALAELYGSKQEFLPIIIGGDHSITLPSVKAFCSAKGGRVGIVHFDTSSDVAELEDGGPSDRTPIRGILEAGIAVAGRNVVQVGLHGFTDSLGHRRYVEEHGATIFSARDVRRQGIERVVERAIEIASAGTDSIYVTLDMDVLDLAHNLASPVSTPGGLTASEVLEAVFTLGSCPMVKAMDLVGVEGYLDVKDETVRIGCAIVLTFIAGYSKRVD